jgi:hypothetical protein
MAKAKSKRAKQENLPGMEQREIRALQNAAHEYAEVRDQRMELTADEVKLKGKLLGLMKENKLEKYKYQDVEIRVVHEEETIKVRIIKPKKAEAE